MNILVTGGCGNIGAHVIKVFADKGHFVRVIDKDAQGLELLAGPQVEILAGDFADKEFISAAAKDIDVILHLAWSFSQDPLVLFESDVMGYVNLLNAAVEHGVQQVINTGTAVSYGKPIYSPVDEEHPRLVEQSRKPMYALAKLATEKLGVIFSQQHGLPVNTVVIWWAYGDAIGGKHVRSMVKDVIQKGELEVPKNCGGSFLQLDDFVAGLEAMFANKPSGQIYNFDTVYLTWEDLGGIIAAKANPQAKIIPISKEEWKGSSFLTEDWQFSRDKAAKELGYKSMFTKEEAVEHLGRALEACIAEVRRGL